MLWFKALHIISVVCWFAGLFYLPRLFVYHALSHDEISNERFKIMERKLYRGIMTPSALLTVIFGGILIGYNAAYYMTVGWIHAKLFLVAVLLVFHLQCWQHLKNFRDDKNTKDHIYFRWFNEVPTFVLIVVVILVVVKPF